jgi:uncharacterized protein YbbK (DUF523 family)
MAPGTGKKPRVGVSSCLLGDKVRYDGESKWHRITVEIIGPVVEWVPLCPEIEIGMGVPRDPVNLVGPVESPSLVAVGTGINWSKEMKVFSRKKIQTWKKQGLNGYIFKSSSPSCGLRKVKVYKDLSREHWVSSGIGMFVSEFLREFPDLPVADEDELSTEQEAEVFIDKIKRHQQFHRDGFIKN